MVVGLDEPVTRTVAPATGRPSRSMIRPVIGTSSRTSRSGRSSVTSPSVQVRAETRRPCDEDRHAPPIRRPDPRPGRFRGPERQRKRPSASEIARSISCRSVSSAAPTRTCRVGSRSAARGIRVHDRRAGDRLAIRSDDPALHGLLPRRRDRSVVAAPGHVGLLTLRFIPEDLAVSTADTDQPGQQRANQTRQQRRGDRPPPARVEASATNPVFASPAAPGAIVAKSYRRSPGQRRQRPLGQLEQVAGYRVRSAPKCTT